MSCGCVNRCEYWYISERGLAYITLLFLKKGYTVLCCAWERVHNNHTNNVYLNCTHSLHSTSEWDTIHMVLYLLLYSNYYGWLHHSQYVRCVSTTLSDIGYIICPKPNRNGILQNTTYLLVLGHWVWVHSCGRFRRGGETFWSISFDTKNTIH